MILPSLGKPKFQNQICYEIGASSPYFVGFQKNADLGSQETKLKINSNILHFFSAKCASMIFAFSDNC